MVIGLQKDGLMIPDRPFNAQCLVIPAYGACTYRRLWPGVSVPDLRIISQATQTMQEAGRKPELAGIFGTQGNARPLPEAG